MVSHTVTTNWRTELGTTLLNGFANTTEIPAYFRCLNSSVCTCRPQSRQVPLPLAPPRGRTAFKELAQNGPGAKQFLAGLVVRAAPFALLRNLHGDADLSVSYATGSNGTSL